MLVKMIKISNFKVNVNDNRDLRDLIAKKYSINILNIKELKILKKSIDARKKPVIYFVYELAIDLKNEDIHIFKNKDISRYNEEKYSFKITGKSVLKHRPIIVGSGPAGLFAAYMLAENGYEPIIFERGEEIDKRVLSVNDFWNNNVLKKNSNVQFGEGGAGTFSDGKLNTLVKDKLNRGKKVYEIFVANNAPEEILYLNKPHIGTDKLREVIKNMRNRIISKGGKFYYNSLVTDINIENDKIKSVIVNNKDEYFTECLVLAIGHSARDTFRMLHQNNFKMEQKPFAVGLRIMHPRKMIDNSQYGNALLSGANYKLTYQTNDHRGVYTFCMCPGGFVVNASSEENKLVINGMSNYDRDEAVSNSAIVITVSENDYGKELFDGVKFQEQLEKKAFLLAHGNIPIQLYKDYKDNLISTGFGEFLPCIKGKYEFANLNELFTDSINENIKKAIYAFGKRIDGFSRDDAILAGVESRTSSPIRILRGDNMQSNIKGVYPIGEGAGYAGGITSAAIDGLKAFEEIISIYKPFS